MKYILIIIIFTIHIVYFIVERIVKILYIIFSFLWEFKLLKDYSFWYRVELAIPIEYEWLYKDFGTVKEYFMRPFEKEYCELNSEPPAGSFDTALGNLMSEVDEKIEILSKKADENKAIREQQIERHKEIMKKTHQ